MVWQDKVTGLLSLAFLAAFLSSLFYIVFFFFCYNFNCIKQREILLQPLAKINLNKKYYKFEEVATCKNKSKRKRKSTNLKRCLLAIWAISPKVLYIQINFYILYSIFPVLLSKIRSTSSTNWKLTRVFSHLNWRNPSHLIWTPSSIKLTWFTVHSWRSLVWQNKSCHSCLFQLSLFSLSFFYFYFFYIYIF